MLSVILWSDWYSSLPNYVSSSISTRLDLVQDGYTGRLKYLSSCIQSQRHLEIKGYILVTVLSQKSQDRITNVKIQKKNCFVFYFSKNIQV